MRSFSKNKPVGIRDQLVFAIGYLPLERLLLAYSVEKLCFRG